MDTAERLLRLLSLLQVRPHWPGDDLADRLEVTTRTLRRDVARLRSLGYPVDAEPGVGGGYRLGAGGRMPPLLLDDDEAVAIVVGLRSTTATTISGVDESAAAALAKLEGVLPVRLRERVTSLQASMVRLPGPELPIVDPDVLSMVATGCRRGEGLRFSYTDHQGRTTGRSVEPFRIVHTGRRWYLVARDRDRDAWRTFRIDRIAAPSLTGIHYSFDDPPDPVAHVAEGTGIAPYDFEARILLHSDFDTAVQCFPPSIGVVERDGERTSILRVASIAWGPLVDFVCRIPGDFEILDPPELRERVAERAARLARASVSHSQR
jgi:predicted DNA-binding transcriptional regulator YafY